MFICVLLLIRNPFYLFVFSIAVNFKPFWSVKLDGGAADDLNAAFFLSPTERPHTTVDLE